MRIVRIAAIVGVSTLSSFGAQIENRHLTLTYNADRPAAALVLQNKLTSAKVELRTVSPEWEFEGTTVGAGLEPSGLAFDNHDEGPRITLEYPEQVIGESKLQLRTVFAVDRELPLIHKYAELSAAGVSGSTLLLKRVTLLDEPFAEPITFQMDGWQSYPVFGEQFFFGVEFPVARGMAADGRVKLSHAPGLAMNLPRKYRTHSAVIGVAAKGRVREAFEDYVASFRPVKDAVHFNYNSWWTSPVPFKEADILGLVKTFEEKLYRGRGASFDTFTLDMGWSDTQGIWKISPVLFPNGFAPVNAELVRQQSRLGLWWSPSNCYSPSSFDNHWAATAGYETLSIPRDGLPPMVLPCLAKGTRYQREAAQNLSEIVKQFKLGQMKFDGYSFECPVATHGHQAGELSREAIASGLIEVFKQLRRANPDLWMETTCFGYDASPWWLKYVNSVIGPFGDDAPYGAVPAPTYRESYTTSRDFYNLHGSVTPVPIAAQEVLGIIHQTPEPMYNDAVTTILRGHEFISLYLNPKFMNASDYAFLADLMEWTRANASLLARTKVIWPETWKKNGPAPIHHLKDMPRESYGYAHWRNGQGLLCVRNPWMAMDEVEIALDEATIGMPANAAGPFAAVQIYPWRDCVAKGLKPGGKLVLHMGPYQTRAIRLVPDSDNLKLGSEPVSEVAKTIQVKKSSSSIIDRKTVCAETQPFGDDYTVVSNPSAKLWQAEIEGTSSLRGWLLHFLVESPPPAAPAGEFEVTVNGTKVRPHVIDSQTGWSAAQAPGKQNTWRWYIVEVPTGEWKVRASLETAGEQAKVSAWLFGTAGAPKADSAIDLAAGKPLLPLAPRYRPGISVEAIAMRSAKDLPTEERTEEAKVDRINGIYLDRLEPVSATQGWGVLNRNQSVWGRPLCIGTKRFARGLGTHAPSRVAYALDGTYKKLHGFAGLDAAVGGAITMEILLDGKKVWESGRLSRGDEAKPIDVSLEGVNELVLVVSDGGDTYQGDHADWADVWLEK